MEKREKERHGEKRGGERRPTGLETGSEGEKGVQEQAIKKH